MGPVDSHGPAAFKRPPPPWWSVDGADVPLESLETGPLPDEINGETIKSELSVSMRDAQAWVSGL